MEKYLVRRPSSSSQKRKPLLRKPRWKMFSAELDGRLSSKLQHQIAGPLLESYSEVAEFPHHYRLGQQFCQTHRALPFRREGVSGIEFDNKGRYLASVTKSGCLTIHDFETLHCLSNDPSSSKKEPESRQLLHLTLEQQLDVVRWSSTNEDQKEVACASTRSGLVLLFDVDYCSNEGLQVLKPKRMLDVDGCAIFFGITDVAYSSTDQSMVFASNLGGVISIWDKRLGDFPCLELSTNNESGVTSIQLNAEDQIIYGASKQGSIYAWDLRGGRTSVAFQSHKEVYHPPLMSVKLASQLEKIESLKAQSDIVPREIHSINFDPSCQYQLAFHLDDGWSGIFNTHSLQVTHVHCPPPASLTGRYVSTNDYTRKPTWLPTSSLYAIGSSSGDGIYLLDFYPDTTSACHVEFREEKQSASEENNQRIHNKFIQLPPVVTACAAHPLNGTIVVGNKKASLMMISQKQQSCGGDCDESNSQ